MTKDQERAVEAKVGTAERMMRAADDAASIGDRLQEAADRESSAINQLIEALSQQWHKDVYSRVFEDDEFGSGQYNESKAVYLTNLLSEGNADSSEQSRYAHDIFHFYMKAWVGDIRWYHYKALAMALHAEAIQRTTYAAQSKSSDGYFQNALYAAILRNESKLCDIESETLYIEELEWSPPEQTFNPKYDEAITKSHDKVRGLLNMFEDDSAISPQEAKKKYSGKEGHELDQREGLERGMVEWRNHLGDERNYRRAYVEMVRGKDLSEEPDPGTLAYMVDNASAKALGARIRRWRKRVGISPTALSAKLGVRVQAVSNWENGHAVPSDDNIKLMARLFGIKPRYLEFGIQEEEAERMAASEKKSLTFADEFVEVPLYTDIKVAAGDGVISFVGDEAETKPLAFRADFFKSRNIDRRKARCLRVGGDSMSPYLMDSDVVLIEYDEQIRVKDGHCYALRYGTELRIKRLKVRLDGGLDLISDNDRYPTESVKQDEMQFVTVLGEVKWRAG